MAFTRHRRRPHFLGQGADDDIGARIRHRQRGRSADAGRATGQQRHFSGKKLIGHEP